MLIFEKLTNNYSELYEEYKEFLKINNFDEKKIKQIGFIYNKKLYNKNCINQNSNLTFEECAMYNLSVDNLILVDNNNGFLYAQLNDKTIIKFRCTKKCLQDYKKRYIKQKILTFGILPLSDFDILIQKNFQN